ncbi:MAG: membrane protein insertase YidC [Melioribacteraceae bacterium]
MDKQSTIAFVLIGIILVVWLQMNAPEPIPNTEQTDSTRTAVTKETPVTTTKEEQTKPASFEKVTEDSVNEFKTKEEAERIITIDTDLALIELTNKGGRIKKYFLKKYKTWYHDDVDSSNFYDSHVQLINTSREGGDFNLVFITKGGQLVNTKDLSFKADSKENYFRISEDDSIEVKYVYSVEENKNVTKVFKFFGKSYSSKADVILENMNDMISGYRYDVEWATGLNFVERNSVDEAQYSNAAAYSGDERVKIDASSVGDVETKVLNGKVDWIGVRNKYFTAIIAPVNPSDEGGAEFKGEHVTTQYGDREYYAANLKIPFSNQNYQKDSYNLYIGPLDYDVLKSNNNNYQEIFEFGSMMGLSIITRPISEYLLLPLFKFLHTFIPNYGWVIIVFTIILKFALYPLTRQSYKSMKKMQQLQPKIAELKEKYKGDQQKVQKETMAMYSTYGVNPAGGCLPMLLQMPVLFALFTFFSIAIELRQEPFMLWITNLSAPDVIFQLPFKIPILNLDTITGLAPLLGITMFFSQKMTVKDPSQKAMVYMMPIMMPLIFMNMSSGLNLYYLLFNLFSVAQQYFINHQEGEELVPVKNPKKKGGFMQKMMAAAEQQQKAQKAGKKKKK